MNKKTFFSFVKKTTLKYCSRQSILRLLTAWLIVATCFVAKSSISFTDFLFFQNISLIWMIAETFVLWLALGNIKNEHLIAILLITVTVLYCFFSLKKEHDIYFLFGCVAITAIMISFINIDTFKIQLSSRKLWIFAILSIFLITICVGGVCCMINNNNWTPNYDFGIFSQMYYYMKKIGLPYTTCERNRLLNHFAVHFSPIYYLLLPVYFFIPTPNTLLILQCLVTFSGVIPLILLCKHQKQSNLSAAAFSLCYLLYPSFTGGCYYYLHENNFLAPLTLWLIYGFEKKRKRFIIPFTILLLAVKEDAPVYVAIIAFYFFFKDCIRFIKAKQEKKIVTSYGLWVFLIAIIYFAIVLKFLSGSGEGVMTGRYDNYIYDNSGNLLTMISAVIKNPIYVINQCLTSEKLIFILEMLLPLGFLPVFNKKAENWILTIPFLLVNLMTNYTYQYNIHFQYAFGSGALLIYLAMINYKELSEKRKKILLVSVASAILVFSYNYENSFHYYWKQYAPETPTLQREVMNEAFSLIPQDASVACSTFLVTALSQRDEVYQIENQQLNTDYYVLDLRYNTSEYDPEYYKSSPNYETIFYEEGIIAVFKAL